MVTKDRICLGNRVYTVDLSRLFAVCSSNQALESVFRIGAIENLRVLKPNWDLFSNCCSYWTVFGLFGSSWIKFSHIKLIKF